MGEYEGGAVFHVDQATRGRDLADLAVLCNANGIVEADLAVLGMLVVVVKADRRPTR